MKISYCFLITDKIKNEKIWYDFFKDSTKSDIIIHCSKSNNLEYLDKLTTKIYVDCVPTSWGKLLQVENFLTEKAKENQSNKCIFLSDSCLPVKNISYIENFLKNDEKSFISNTKPWDMTRFPDSIKHLDLMGNHQWIIIDEKHYDLFLKSELRKIFEEETILPEESYHSTILQLNNLNNDDNVRNVVTTYVDWSRPSNNGNSPYTFNLNNTDHQVLSQLESNHLFIRKVADNLNTDFIRTIESLIL